MDDMQNQISALLSDEECLKNLQELSQMLKNADDGAEQAAENDAEALTFDIGKLMAVGQAMQGMGNDRNISLLLALKPVLSRERGVRVDRAVKMLRLYGAYNTLKEQGLLNNLLGE